MAFSLVLFLAGFVILVGGARLLVRGAVSVATILKISPWAVGVAIVGIGTSIPELSISISAVLHSNSVGIGTLIGNTTFNLLFTLGLIALLSPIALSPQWRKDLVINVAVTVIAFAIVLLPVLGDSAFIGISREEGGLLFGLFIVWLLVMLSRKAIPDDGADYQVLTAFSSFVMITAGIAGVFLGGQWVVSGAETIAGLFGVSSAVIGLTIVAAGASLPELTVSLIAMLKKQNGMAVGNLIGSSIFDFLGILGITALIRPLPVIGRVQVDFLAAVVATTLVLLLAFYFGKKGKLSRTEGVLLLLSYFAYLFFVIN